MINKKQIILIGFILAGLFLTFSMVNAHPGHGEHYQPEEVTSSEKVESSTQSQVAVQAIIGIQAHIKKVVLIHLQIKIIKAVPIIKKIQIIMHLKRLLQTTKKQMMKTLAKQIQSL